MFKNLFAQLLVWTARAMLAVAVAFSVVFAGAIVGMVAGAIVGIALGLHVAGFVPLQQWKPMTNAARIRIMERRIRKSEPDSEIESPANVVPIR